MPDPRVKAVAGVYFFVELFQGGFGGVEVADIVLGGVFGAFLVEQVAHAVFDFSAIVAFFNNVILMKNVAEKMPVIKFDGNLLVNIGGQVLDPIRLVTL